MEDSDLGCKGCQVEVCSSQRRVHHDTMFWKAVVRTSIESRQWT